jgi:SAM-dependent methyltransferase
MIFLPGLDQQAKFLCEFTEVKGKKILIIGPGTLEAAGILEASDPAEINIIVGDYDSLINMRYEYEKSPLQNVRVKMMEYDNTDFKAGSFDIIYSQGTISGSDRNKIIKEIRKILKSEGIFCAGEIISLKKDPPVFINNIWQSSDLLPLLNDEVEKYYKDRGFEILNQKDLSFTLREFYLQAEKLSAKSSSEMNEQEKSYHKKLLRKLSHESNAYLKLGGHEYIGFKALIMRKKQN